MTNSAENIQQFLDQGLLDDAIHELKALEISETGDNSNAVALAAALERTRSRVREKAINPEDAEQDTLVLISRAAALLGVLKKATRRTVPTEPKPSDKNSPSLKVEPDTVSNVLLLVHGIRTHAEWFELVDQLMTSKVPCQVVTVRFGYVNLPQFLWPFGKRHSWPVQKVKDEIRSARRKYPNAKITAIARSFGTFALVHALTDATVDVDRILMCAAIVPERWDFQRQLLFGAQSTSIVNDCSNQDIWPVAAKCLGWGFGSTGSFGFGKTGIRDRSFPLKHSQFFEPAFVAKFWVPFVRDGSIVPPSLSDIRKPVHILSIISSNGISGLIRIIVWFGPPIALILLLNTIWN